MRRQKTIVAASRPRTPINGPNANRIEVPRNRGDSGIFTAASRLYPVRSFNRKAADAGPQNASPLAPPTTRPCTFPTDSDPSAPWTIPHHSTQTPTAALGLRRRRTVRALAFSPHDYHGRPVGTANKPDVGTPRPESHAAGGPFLSEAKKRCYGQASAATRHDTGRAGPHVSAPHPRNAHCAVGSRSI
jgi:hypothetical protein